jgi:hypothetical protein
MAVSVGFHPYSSGGVTPPPQPPAPSATPAPPAIPDPKLQAETLTRETKFASENLVFPDKQAALAHAARTAAQLLQAKDLNRCR